MATECRLQRGRRRHPLHDHGDQRRQHDAQRRDGDRPAAPATWSAPGQRSPLAPGDSITCTASHTITQADIDAGSFFNQACVDDGAGGAAEACDDVTTPGDQNPRLSITKVATETGFSAVGDVIHYTITATNNGNMTLTTSTVTDPNGQRPGLRPGQRRSPLAPGDSITCTASHTITQADIDAGSFFNQACVDDGAGGAARRVTTSPRRARRTRPCRSRRMATEASYSAVGDVIHYTIMATNNGNIDAARRDGDRPERRRPVCTRPTVAAGTGRLDDCTASHTITQADLDAGSFFNQACVDDGAGGADEACDDVTTPAVLRARQPDHADGYDVSAVQGRYVRHAEPVDYSLKGRDDLSGQPGRVLLLDQGHKAVRTRSRRRSRGTSRSSRSRAEAPLQLELHEGQLDDHPEPDDWGRHGYLRWKWQHLLHRDQVLDGSRGWEGSPQPRHHRPLRLLDGRRCRFDERYRSEEEGDTLGRSPTGTRKEEAFGPPPFRWFPSSYPVASKVVFARFRTDSWPPFHPYAYRSASQFAGPPFVTQADAAPPRRNSAGRLVQRHVHEVAALVTPNRNHRVLPAREPDGVRLEARVATQTQVAVRLELDGRGAPRGVPLAPTGGGRKRQDPDACG